MIILLTSSFILRGAVFTCHVFFYAMLVGLYVTNVISRRYEHRTDASYQPIQEAAKKYLHL